MNTDTVNIRPDWRQFIINELPNMALTVLLLVIGGLDIPFSSVFFCIALALLFLLYYRLMYLRNIEYTITDQQLVYSHGIFTRSRDYIELYRIVDYDEKRSLMQQIAGLKTIIVHSGDRTMPRLRIIGIREDTDLVHLLRERVAYNRSRMNIHEFANYI